MKVKPEICWLAVLLVAGCASGGSMQAADPPAAAPAAAAPEPEPEPEPEPAVAATIWDGVFTSAQANRGQETAQAVCFACHSQSEWTNPMFIRVWSGRPIHQMWENLRMTMPYDSPGRLSAQEYSDVVAYMLELNGAPAGETELPADAEGLMQITVTPGQ